MWTENVPAYTVTTDVQNAHLISSLPKLSRNLLKMPNKAKWFSKLVLDKDSVF